MAILKDTKVMTLYDGDMYIEDIAKSGSDFMVYSWNPETKLPEVGLLQHKNITAFTLEFWYNIVFDSGLVVRCLPDHEFYVFRGYKVSAEDLIVGQAVRAFSTSVHRDGHLRAHGWVDGKAKHRYVARMVWEFFHGPVPKDMIIHHKDFIKLNNHITNLELLTNSMHNSVHYPYRKDGGFFRGKNHKIVDIYKDVGTEVAYSFSVEKMGTYIIPDKTPISGNGSGIVSCV